MAISGPNPVKIKLPENQRKELEIIVGRRNSSQRLVLRAKIILLADEGKTHGVPRQNYSGTYFA